jgi:hypothetical protein
MAERSIIHNPDSTHLNMDNNRVLNLDWVLWFQWIMATTLGWVLGRFLFPNLAAVMIGIGLGIFQWLILQHRIGNAWRWIVATAIGWAFGALIIEFFLPPGQDFIAGLLSGVMIGIPQWLILKQEVSWSFWWIMINIVAWTTGMAFLPGVMLTGVIVGALTGIALILLIRFPKPGLSSERKKIV